jgi:hypothetical protein
MATGRATHAGPIRLNFRSIQQVVVEPEDENRFLMTAREATRACEQAQGEKELREQFTQFMLYLHKWCEAHADEVCAAYVYPGDGFLNILVCTRGDGYRFDFDDQVTELDIDVARQFGWLRAEVMQVPESAREGQVSLEKAILVYGDGSSPRPPSEP